MSDLSNALSPSSEYSVVDVIASTGRCNTLLSALEAADLIATLQQEGTFTVFAPTDEAFEQLDGTLLKELLADQTRLREALCLHVAPCTASGAELGRVSTLETVHGQPLTVESTDALCINNACVIEGDLEASNGIVHLIDSVLMPL